MSAGPVVPAVLVFSGCACDCTLLILRPRTTTVARGILAAAEGSRWDPRVPPTSLAAQVERAVVLGEAVRVAERTGIVVLPDPDGGAVRGWMP